jgi:hypothetical protein
LLQFYFVSFTLSQPVRSPLTGRLLRGPDLFLWVRASLALLFFLSAMKMKNIPFKIAMFLLNG